MIDNQFQHSTYIILTSFLVGVIFGILKAFMKTLEYIKNRHFSNH